jgi:hypothetical protein
MQEVISTGGRALNQELISPLGERHSKRIQVALPIRVTYWDGDHRPALEIACTYDISQRGARVTGLRCVKGAGEIIAIERGKCKAFCRVVWIGQPNSEWRGQIGIQCVESDRTLWEAELRDMEEAYDPILVGGALQRSSAYASHERRRRRERFASEGMAELVRPGPNGLQIEAALRNLSEIGCLVVTKHMLPPGTELKLALNVDDYDLTLKGQVRHGDPHVGLGIEFREILKGERQILQFLMRKLAEKSFEDSLQFEVHR